MRKQHSSVSHVFLQISSSNLSSATGLPQPLLRLNSSQPLAAELFCSSRKHPSQLVHLHWLLTATCHRLAHGCLSTKKESIVKAKSPPWMFVIIYISVSPNRAPARLYTSQWPSPRVKAVSTKGNLGDTGRRGLWEHSKRTQVPHFPTDTLPKSSLSIFKSTDPNT